MVYDARGTPLDVIDLSQSGSGVVGWRLKIKGLVVQEVVVYYDFGGGTVVIEDEQTLCSQGRGFWWLYGGSPSITLRVYLRGFADYVEVYREVPGAPRSNYAAYVLITDVDGNGLSEVVFTTEDANYGTVNPPGILLSCTEDDVAWVGAGSGSWVPLRDSSEPLAPGTCSFAEPLREAYNLSHCPVLIYLTGPQYVVDGSRYQLVVVTARLYYHDSEGGDVNCVDNPRQFMVGFFLVDPGPDGVPATVDDRVVSSHMLMYQQLDDWEDTWPPNRNFVTVTVPLLVPNEDKIFYVAVGFVDPYDNYAGYDDVEFTAAIEAVGLIFYARGG